MSALENIHHEQFAQGVVRLGNKAAAYREVYGTSDAHPRWQWELASRCASRPDVARRIDELLKESCDASVADHAAAVRHALDIATADPSAISRVFFTCCRHCHGTDFHYQWTANEYGLACEAATSAGNAPPPCDGGLDFNAHAEPHAACPECLGMGVRHEWYCDPTKLTGKEAKLYAGLHPKSQLPMCHDQDAAWDRVCRLMGWNKELVKIPDVVPVGDVAPGDAGKHYLAMIAGGKRIA